MCMAEILGANDLFQIDPMRCPIPPKITFGHVFRLNFPRRVSLLLLSDEADVLQECSAEQEASVSRLLLVLLSAGLPFTSNAYQTDTKSGTNWHWL